MVLYFNPVTREIWLEDPSTEPNSRMNTDEDQTHEVTSARQPSAPQNPPVEDFGDDEINAAVRLTRTVSYAVPSTTPEVS